MYKIFIYLYLVFTLVVQNYDSIIFMKMFIFISLIYVYIFISDVYMFISDVYIFQDGFYRNMSFVHIHVSIIIIKCLCI